MHKIIPFIILVIYLPTLLFAECTPLSSSDITTLVESIASDHPIVKQQKNKQEISSEEIQKALAEFDPMLSAATETYGKGYYSGSSNIINLEKQNQLLGSSFGLGYRKGSGSFPIYEDQYQTSSGGEFFASLTIPLLRNMRVNQPRLALEQRKIEQKIAEIELNNTKNYTRGAFLEIFNNLITAKTNIDLYLAIIDKIKNQRKILEERVSVGAAAKNDLAEVDRFIIKNEILLTHEKNYLKNNLILINKIYLTFIDRELAECSIPKLSKKLFKIQDDYQSLIKKSFQLRPDLKVLKSQLKLTEITIDFLDNQKLPELNFRVEYADGVGSGRDSDQEQYIKNLLELNYPLFNRKPKAAKLISELEWKNIELELTLLKRKLSSELLSYLNNIETIIKQLELVNQEITILQRLLEADYLSYEAGNLELFQINQRNTLLLEVQIEQAKLYNEYNRQVVLLQIFLNDPKPLKDLYRLSLITN